MATPKLQLLSRTQYDTDGSTTVWDFNFAGGYILPEHVKAYYDAPGGVRTYVTGTLIGGYQLQIVPPIPAGNVLTIQRQTPKDQPLVDFTDRGVVSETALDTVARQAVFVAAEASDDTAVANVDVALTAAGTAVAAKNEAVAAASVATGAAATLRSDLAAPAGAESVGFTPAGSGAVATTVQAYLRALATVGQGANVVAVDMPPYNGNLSAALDAVPEGTVLVLGNRDYNIVGKYSFTGGGPYVGNYKKDITLMGAGMPRASADGSRLVSGSGTVIQGCVLNFADGFKVFNLGVDAGPWVAANLNGDNPIPEAFVPGTHRFQGTPFDGNNYIKDVAFDNVISLAGPSTGHAVLIEFTNGAKHGYVEAVGGIHGYVVKSINLQGGDVWSYGQTVDSYIFKSDENTLCRDVEVNSICIGKRGYARSSPGLFQSKNGGLNTGAIRIGRLSGTNCKELINRVGDNAPITDVYIGSVDGDDIAGTGIILFGDVRRFTIGKHNIANATSRGIYVDSADPNASAIDLGEGSVTNCGGDGIYYAGPNVSHGRTVLVNNGGFGIFRTGGAQLKAGSFSGSGNASGLANSLLDFMTSANLINGWANTTSWPFQVVAEGGMYHFRGTVSGGTSGVIAVMPVGTRPPFTLSFAVPAVRAGGAIGFAYIDIYPNGEITVANFSGAAPGLGGAGCTVSLNFSYLS